MKRVVITGLGFVTSIGNCREEVLQSLRTGKTGVEPFPEFVADPLVPVTLVGTVKGFGFPGTDFEEWTFPATYKISRELLRPMAPNTLYAYFAMRQAIDDAGLTSEQVSDPETGLMTANGGSMLMSHKNFELMDKRGVMKTPPMSIINAIPGSLYINLVPAFRIKGASLGFSSACSSSAHALGMAVDLVRSGRQKRVFVVGAEDCNRYNLLPFATVRALSLQTDPRLSPCAFDKKRDGFVGTGGAAVLVVEELDAARERGATRIHAEVLGWGQASDGYNVLASAPDGDGLARTMQMAMADAKVAPADIEYINAHATSTPFGDASEIQAIKRAFPDETQRPLVSSTKSLTGHGLSLAGAMEAGFCCLSLTEGFVPTSAHITELDPVCEGVPVITQPTDLAPTVVMNNSSGFGGTNVSVVLRKWE